MNWNDAYHFQGRAVRSRIESVKPLEEPLNHLLNIFFALAPNGFIAKVFDVGPADVVGLRTLHFSELGPAAVQTGKPGDYADLCQPDVYFVSPALRACVELKVGSMSSLEQVLKYSALMSLCPAKPATKVSRKLLLLGPESGFSGFWERKRYPDATSLKADIARIDDPALDRKFRRIGTTLAEAKAGVDGLAISCLGFADLARLVSRELENVRPFTAGGEVYGKLLAGLKAELAARELPAKRGAARAPGASAA